tara:strand:+ start:7277 stop:7831 length:555 start_codon:yes stop_codon:yes gene_type:complete
MSTGSFAEILREKLEKNDKKTHFSSAKESFSSINTPSKEELELNQLHQRLFEQQPNSFSVSKAKMSETPYRRFQNRGRYTNEAADWAKKGQTKANSAETKNQTTAKPPPRPKGPPHKLNDKQTLAMSYFINEKMFLLGDFTPDELKKAYRKLALIKHPDSVTGSAHSFLELKKQYECLSSVFKK